MCTSAWLMADPCHPSIWDPETRASGDKLGCAVILTQPPLRSKNMFQTHNYNFSPDCEPGNLLLKQNPTY